MQDSPELEKVQRAFIKATREAQFLFDKDVYSLLEQMNKDAFAVAGYKHDIAPKLNGPELIAPYNDFVTNLNQFYAAFPQLEKNMRKYLNFHGLYSWR